MAEQSVPLLSTELAVPREEKALPDEPASELLSVTSVDAADTSESTWSRELSRVRSSRQSRASSIVSTRTRFSTTTMDEVRSIDINAGGYTFRISRDGSKITDTTAPPPYPGSLYGNESDNESVLGDQEAEEDHDQLEAHEPEREPRKRVRIVMPGEDDDDDEADADDSHSKHSPDIVVTRAEFYRILLDLPWQLKRVLGLSPPKQLADLAISSDIGDAVPDASDAGTSTYLDGNHGQAEVRAGPSTYLAQHKKHYEDTNVEQPLSHSGGLDASSSTDTLRPVSREHFDMDTALTVGDLNDLSSVYNKVVKDLDREHRKRLHEKDKELASLRLLLNEKDIVYRQQLKGKDFIIEDLKTQLNRHEDVLEQQLERARNEVEDVWEARWKAQYAQLMERSGHAGAVPDIMSRTKDESNNSSSIVPGEV